jgi:SAM-dependent methyltransferase
MANHEFPQGHPDSPTHVTATDPGRPSRHEAQGETRQDRLETYTRNYVDDYGFEANLVAARQELILKLLEKERPGHVIEVGCGAELLYQRAVEHGLPIERWVIVEPSRTFADLARQASTASIPLQVVEGFFDEVALDLPSVGADTADMILIAGLLHELRDPDGAISLAREVLDATGMLHVNVPNAGSMHRRLAKAMGMISSVNELSDRNRKFGQYRVYDSVALHEAVTRAGFSVEEEGGYFIKPFTDQQMTSIENVLTPKVIGGLVQLGQDFPELACEIFVNARLPE